MIHCILVILDDGDVRLHAYTVYLPVSVDYIDFVRLRPINLIVNERERRGRGREGEREGGREGERERKRERERERERGENKMF